MPAAQTDSGAFLGVERSVLGKLWRARLEDERAALALAHRYNLDSRDQGKQQRAEAVASEAGIWNCTFVGECSEVCPKDVDPAAAIQRTKVATTSDWFRSFLLPGKKK